VLLLQLQFGRVFDGNDPLDVRNVSGKYIEQSSFAGACAARDQQIQSSFHHDGKQFEHGFGQGVVFDHVAGRDRVTPETPDGKAGAIQCERGNNGVYARTIGQPGVDHGRRFIDPAAHSRNDSLDDLHEVLVVLEGQARQLQLTGALDVYLVEAVHQDVGNGVILKQRFERTEAEDFVKDFARQALALGKA